MGAGDAGWVLITQYAKVPPEFQPDEEFINFSVGKETEGGSPGGSPPDPGTIEARASSIQAIIASHRTPGLVDNVQQGPQSTVYAFSANFPHEAIENIRDEISQAVGRPTVVTENIGAGSTVTVYWG